MPLVSPGFLLPRDVESDYGFQQAFSPVTPAIGTSFSRKTPGEFFEIPVAFTCRLSTDGTAVTRTCYLEIIDGDAKRVDLAVAALAQGGPAVFSYRWSLALSGAYTVGGNFSETPLFANVIPPGWTLRLVVQNQQAGDQVDAISYVAQQFNTGVEPERFKTVQPLDVRGLGSLSLSAPLGTITAPLDQPAAASPGAAPVRAPAAAPAQAPVVDLSTGPNIGPTKYV